MANDRKKILINLDRSLVQLLDEIKHNANNSRSQVISLILKALEPEIRKQIKISRMIKLDGCSVVI